MVVSTISSVMLPVSCIPRRLACILYTWIFAQYGVYVVTIDTVGTGNSTVVQQF